MVDDPEGRPLRILYLDDESEFARRLLGNLRARGVRSLLTLVGDSIELAEAQRSCAYDVALVGKGHADTLRAIGLLDAASPFVPHFTTCGGDVPDGELSAWIDDFLARGDRGILPSLTLVHLDDQDRRERLLDAIAAHEGKGWDRLHRYLRLGVREFGLDKGIVTEVQGDEIRVVTGVNLPPEVVPGLRFHSSETFCIQILKSEAPLAIQSVGHSWLADHPARARFGLETYFACRVGGSPKSQVALCFFSDRPQANPYSAEDVAFLRRLARRVDVEVQNQAKESELSLIQGLFDSFMDNAPIVATLKDREGRYHYVNRNDEPTFGGWLDDAVGNFDHETLDEADFESILAADRRVLDNGEVLQITIPMHIPNHEVRYWQILKFPAPLPDGYGVGSVAVDVTDRVEAENRLAEAYEGTLEGWVRTLETRDRETHGHSQRVAEMTVELARKLGVGEPELTNIWRGALLHDLGKIGIPDAILNKEGKLTDAEWRIMRQHPEIAVELISTIAFLRPALEIPFCHHERWNGSGYPQGLRGEDIPHAARIFAVVDVFDALTSDRPYRKAMDREEALRYLEELAGTELDPEVVGEFVRIRREAMPKSSGS